MSLLVPLHKGETATLDLSSAGQERDHRSACTAGHYDDRRNPRGSNAVGCTTKGQTQHRVDFIRIESHPSLRKLSRTPSRCGNRHVGDAAISIYQALSVPSGSVVQSY